jgi:type IV fimbrial biogenesis protein FimT
MTAALDPAIRKICRRGVTLLELAIVLVVLAVLAAIAVPSFAAAMDRGRLKKSAETLLADLTEARLKAAERGTALHWSGEAAAAGRWCYAVATRPECGCGPAAATCTPREKLHQVSAEQHLAVAMLEMRTSAFSADGRAVPGGATFATARGERLRVDIPPSGRARICSPEGSVSGYPAC